VDAAEPQPARPSAGAFGVWLATRGVAVRASLVLIGVGTAAGVTAAVIGRDRPWVNAVPAIGAAAIAWGAGVMVAFAAALKVVHRDQNEGVLALLRARGVGPGGYVVARAGGLVAVLAGAMGAGVACIGAASTMASSTPLPTARASLGAVAYALAFAATVGPVAMATVGGRSRGLGYLALLSVLALPEALAPWTSDLLPPGWRELTSIPAALDAVRHGVARAGFVAPAARAVVGLGVTITASLLVVRARAARVSSEAVPGGGA
jgi:hypothetical protein